MKHALRKAQLTPIYLIILVILIVAFFAVVNIAKVALVKTHSANAADAGSLAAASVMANALNAAAVTNRDMLKRFWEFQDILRGGTSYSAYGTIIEEIPAYLGGGMCEASAESTKEFIGLVVSLEYIALLYTMRQLRAACLTAKNLQDAWMRAHNLALELAVMNSGFFANIAPEARRAYVNWFNSASFTQQPTLSFKYPRLLIDPCNPNFHAEWQDSKEGRHTLDIDIAVDKRRLVTVESTLYWQTIAQAFMTMLEGARQQYLLAVYACVGCRILDYPETCGGAISNAAQAVNSSVHVPLMNQIRSLLIAQTRIVDSGTGGSRGWCSAYGGRCTSTQDYYAGLDPASMVGESAPFIAAVANQARRMHRPGIKPALGGYPAVRAYLIRAVSAAMHYPSLPVIFYFQEDVGGTRSAVVRTRYENTPVKYTFWEATFPTLQSFSESSFNYTLLGNIAPPGYSFSAGIVRTDQLEEGKKSPPQEQSETPSEEE